MLLRFVTGRRLDAILLCLLAITSASAMFWLVLPEVFGWGSVTITVALCFAALQNQYILPGAAYVIVSALTLSMTVTNWMLGILVTFAGQCWRRAIQLTINAFFIVAMLWGVQKIFIPSSQFFLSFPPRDVEFVLNPASGGGIRVTHSFVFHTMVMPEIHLQSASDPLWYGMTTQHAMPGSGTFWGSIAVVLWLALLALGVHALITIRQHLVLRKVLVISLILQLILHILYGYETFLYSLHFLPLLLSVVALGTLTRFRTATLVLAGMLVLTCGINNGLQLAKAIKTVDWIAGIAESYK